MAHEQFSTYWVRYCRGDEPDIEGALSECVPVKRSARFGTSTRSLAKTCALDIREEVRGLENTAIVLTLELESLMEKDPVGTYWKQEYFTSHPYGETYPGLPIEDEEGEEDEEDEEPEPSTLDLLSQLTEAYVENAALAKDLEALKREGARLVASMKAKTFEVERLNIELAGMKGRLREHKASASIQANWAAVYGAAFVRVCVNPNSDAACESAHVYARECADAAVRATSRVTSKEQAASTPSVSTNVNGKA